MKHTIYILITLVATFLIPMLTSWLLDWTWITAEAPRYKLVVLFMVAQIIIGTAIFLKIVKSSEE